MQNICGKQFSDGNSWTRSSATDAPYMDETVSCFSFRGTKAWGVCSYGMLVVVSHFRNSLSVPSLHMGPIGCLETSVNKCHLASRNVLEERSQLHGDGNLKTRTEFFVRQIHEQKFPSAALVGEKKPLASFLQKAFIWRHPWTKTDVCPRIVQVFQKCGSDLSISYGV